MDEQVQHQGDDGRERERQRSVTDEPVVERCGEQSDVQQEVARWTAGLLDVALARDAQLCPIVYPRRHADPQPTVDLGQPGPTAADADFSTAGRTILDAPDALGAIRVRRHRHPAALAGLARFDRLVADDRRPPSSGLVLSELQVGEDARPARR